MYLLHRSIARRIMLCFGRRFDRKVLCSVSRRSYGKRSGTVTRIEFVAGQVNMSSRRVIIEVSVILLPASEKAMKRNCITRQDTRIKM